jgi:hypothetical protein
MWARPRIWFQSHLHICCRITAASCVSPSSLRSTTYPGGDEAEHRDRGGFGEQRPPASSRAGGTPRSTAQCCWWCGASSTGHRLAVGEQGPSHSPPSGLRGHADLPGGECPSRRVQGLGHGEAGATELEILV